MNTKNIQIVLVETSHPGNIGAAARAMKTMGLTELALVNPRFFPDPEAEAMASGAQDILASAKLFPSLSDAIGGSHWVVGASARLRGLPIPTDTPRGLAPRVIGYAQVGEISLVFGRESHGLYNEELDLCHELLHIPSDSQYGSLNLAQAVQIVCYELRVFGLSEVRLHQKPEAMMALLATVQEREGFFEHLEKTLWDIQFIRKHNPREVMRKLRRLFDRTTLKKEEINILRGILTAVKNYRGEKT